MGEARRIREPSGKLGVLLVGMGAVSTTFIAGVELIKRGLGRPVGSLTQMALMEPGGEDGALRRVKELLPLYRLEDLVFGGWDVLPDDAYEAAVTAGVLEKGHLEAVKEELQRVVPWPAVFERRYVHRIEGTNTKRFGSLREAAELIREDIRRFKRQHALERAVMINCASTEAYLQPDKEAYSSLEAFERALDVSDEAISPAMLYAYAAIKEGVGYANGAPSIAADIPALVELARESGVPVAGKDFKTGQTLIKTIMAPGLKARMLGIEGWYSTNILGNRDGEVLDDPDSLKSKELSKLSVLEWILQPELYPELYGDISHVVKIDYYRPRGDSKEGWDNIDIFGWLGYPMQIKINFLARDSILAAPVVLDLALFVDLAGRAGMGGIQEWLSFYFKSPMTAPGLYPEHDLFIQLMKLKNTLRELRGEEVRRHEIRR
ncbi:inositol-3-phosphate synthase [Rubrobacter taiwanensis]|uniref:Inositol-3-phosphate synthase n=1 Tax=Rubrobacter taiwanensis TaxID=185139 RepID=A0A4R1BI93_9ACTN|nr:inositol-3-phosphate synthase [Rubrobacter taiwanensis]